MAAPSPDQLFGDTTDYVVFGGVVVATVLLAPSGDRHFGWRSPLASPLKASLSGIAGSRDGHMTAPRPDHDA